MKRMSATATKSFSQAGNKKTVTVRVSNGKTSVTRKATIQTK